jgi:glycerol-3-phosphate dehydrogenase
MQIDLNEEEIAARTAPDEHHRRRSLSAVAQNSETQGDPHQDPAGTRARAIAAGEALRAAASDDGQKAPLGALGVKSESGPPMTLGNAAATQVRLIVWCEACRHQVDARSRRTSAANNTHRGLLSAQAASLRSMAFRRDWLAKGSGP